MMRSYSRFVKCRNLSTFDVFSSVVNYSVCLQIVVIVVVVVVAATHLGLYSDLSGGQVLTFTSQLIYFWIKLCLFPVAQWEVASSFAFEIQSLMW